MKNYKKIIRRVKRLNKSMQFTIALFFVLVVTAVASVAQLVSTSNFDLRQQAADDPGGGGGLYAPTNTPVPTCRPGTESQASCEQFNQVCIPDGNCWKPKPDPTATPSKKPIGAICQDGGQCNSEYCSDGFCQEMPTRLYTCRLTESCPNPDGCFCPSNCNYLFAPLNTNCGGEKPTPTPGSGGNNCPSGTESKTACEKFGDVCVQDAWTKCWAPKVDPTRTPTPTPTPICQSKTQCEKFGDTCFQQGSCWVTGTMCYGLFNCASDSRACVCRETFAVTSGSCPAGQYSSFTACDAEAKKQNNQVSLCEPGESVCLHEPVPGQSISERRLLCNSDGSDWITQYCGANQVCSDATGTCITPVSPLSSCTTPCFSTGGCSCPSNCKYSTVNTYANTCGGVDCNKCSFGVGQDAECFKACGFTNLTPAVTPPSLGTCSTSITCQSSVGCNCPTTCVNSFVAKGESCGGIAPSPYPSPIAQAPYSTATQCSEFNGNIFGCYSLSGCIYDTYSHTCGAIYGKSSNPTCGVNSSGLCSGAVIGTACNTRNNTTGTTDGLCARNTFADAGDTTCVCEAKNSVSRVEVSGGNTCPSGSLCICKTSGSYIESGQYCPRAVSSGQICPANSPSPGCWCNTAFGRTISVGEQCYDRPEDVAKFVAEGVGLTAGGFLAGPVLGNPITQTVLTAYGGYETITQLTNASTCDLLGLGGCEQYYASAALSAVGTGAGVIGTGLDPAFDTFVVNSFYNTKNAASSAYNWTVNQLDDIVKYIEIDPEFGGINLGVLRNTNQTQNQIVRDLGSDYAYLTVPVYPEWPDGAVKGLLDAAITDDVATINHVRVGSTFERQGVGSSLVQELQSIDNINVILANPSLEAANKGFYEANGFFLDQSTGFYIWKRYR